jgi:hypothetical protein
LHAIAAAATAESSAHAAAKRQSGPEHRSVARHDDPAGRRPVDARWHRRANAPGVRPAGVHVAPEPLFETQVVAARRSRIAP